MGSGETVKIVPSDRDGGTLKDYANNVDISWTGHDVALQFGEVRRNPEVPGVESTISLVRKAIITMSWSQAKTLRNALTILIDRYEKVNGEIKDPQEI